MFRAMSYSQGFLSLIDQRALPHKELWIKSRCLEDVAKAIEDMVVRGAPAIGCAAAFGIACQVHADAASTPDLKLCSYQETWNQYLTRMAATRPTAVNLFYAIKHMRDLWSSQSMDRPLNQFALDVESKALALEADDLKTCQAIGSHGLEFWKGQKKARVLTHCNTGSLATAGYGTALGVIRSLHKAGRLEMVLVDETRPYLQGARLTAFELEQDGIPYTLISDNMAAYAMQKSMVDFVVVGADRIAANGDTANKIGTYNLAVLCQYHNIPFAVAAPKATIDVHCPDGARIPVEQRPSKELLEVQGVAIAPTGSQVWNPSFDVTPAHLISAIITEETVCRGPYAF
jgi:methylthioribose-1-phosphate isomerase